MTLSERSHTEAFFVRSVAALYIYICHHLVNIVRSYTAVPLKQQRHTWDGMSTLCLMTQSFMKPGLRTPCTFILILFLSKVALLLFSPFCEWWSCYIVLRAVCCTKECRSLCKYASDHLHLFTMSFLSLTCTLSVLFYHLIHSIACLFPLE